MPIKMPDGETKIVPVSFTVPEDARDGQKITLRMTVQGPPEDVPPPPTAAMIGGVEEEEWRLRDQFRFRRMPWWVVFMVGVYGILKVVALYESPCAVLGVASPVEKRAVTKAYRSLSMCTHPDRMVGKTDADKDRGEVLFTRMTEARDELNDYLDKGGRQSNCREHPNCVPGRKEFGEKKFLKRCSKPQSVTFRGASETETLSMLCPCSCKDFAHPEGGVDAVSCYRELGLHAGFHARYAEATEYLSKAVELDASDAEAQFQLATALGYVDRSEESDEHYQIALELRSGTPAPEPHEQARQLAIGLMQEAEEARAFFYEVTSARRAALADLPKKLPWALWTRVGLFE